MSEKILNSRVQQKHDIETNWLKATNFIPKLGEVIVYDPDSNCNFPRIKVGDGTTTVINLPFVYEPVSYEMIAEICGTTVTVDEVEY